MQGTRWTGDLGDCFRHHIMNGFPEYDTKRLSGGRRSLVLSVGILSIALSLAGLVTYAVVQVLLRVKLLFMKTLGPEPQIFVRRISV